MDRNFLSRSLLTRSFPEWRSLLANDADHGFILAGLSECFRVVSDVAAVLPSEARNYRGALRSGSKPHLHSLFQSELNAWLIIECFCKLICLQAMSAVPKKGPLVPSPSQIAVDHVLTRSIHISSHSFSCSTHWLRRCCSALSIATMQLST